MILPSFKKENDFFQKSSVAKFSRQIDELSKKYARKLFKESLDANIFLIKKLLVLFLGIFQASHEKFTVMTWGLYINGSLCTLF